MDYEDQILLYLKDQKPGWKKPVLELTDNKEKFVAAVKLLKDEGAISDIYFTKNYESIYREDNSPGFKQTLKNEGIQTFNYKGKTYQL